MADAIRGSVAVILAGLVHDASNYHAMRDVKNTDNAEMAPVFAHRAGMDDIVLYVSHLFLNLIWLRFWGTLCILHIL